MDDKDVNDFFLSIPSTADANDTSSSSSEADSDIEITSTFDEQENELIRIDNLCLHADGSSDDDIPILNHSTIPNDPVAQSLEDNEISVLDVSMENPSAITSCRDSGASGTPSQKRKRRAWSVREKLRAIEYYEKSKSKHSTAKAMGCTRFQLSEWLERKEELKNLQPMKRGKLVIDKTSSFSRIFLDWIVLSNIQLLFFVVGSQRKRLKGAGSKLKYFDLDDRLIKWFNERRTPPTSNVTSTEIRRERISFKQLFRSGTKISSELNHEAPSIKWYRRFMLRHNLSLQRPKRNQKIPLSEAHERATSFYNYLRRASSWGPRRGPMGAFMPKDVCNFDESPLSLFGDQTKRSLNYVNVDNEVEGSICSKVSLLY
jgi:hypothetical protein